MNTLTSGKHLPKEQPIYSEPLVVQRPATEPMMSTRITKSTKKRKRDQLSETMKTDINKPNLKQLKLTNMDTTFDPTKIELNILDQKTGEGELTKKKVQRKQKVFKDGDQPSTPSRENVKTNPNFKPTTFSNKHSPKKESVGDPQIKLQSDPLMSPSLVPAKSNLLNSDPECVPISFSANDQPSTLQDLTPIHRSQTGCPNLLQRSNQILNPLPLGPLPSRSGRSKSASRPQSIANQTTPVPHVSHNTLPRNNAVFILWKGKVLEPSFNQLRKFKGNLNYIMKNVGFREPTSRELAFKEIRILFQNQLFRPTPYQLLQAQGDLHALKSMFPNVVSQSLEAPLTSRRRRNHLF